ncbi:MFS transporter [Streptomyces sp. NPDC007983]|uniref:MFS transporter n=1 Tax=Streptomyces sp. NPDC007983 TaxID=3364800 RepID=UPI0036E9BA6B
MKATGSWLLIPLQQANFRRLATGRLLMYFANAMAPVVLAFTVLDLAHSPAALGLVVGARSIANVVLLLFGGVLADRFGYRLAIQGSALAACALQGAIAICAHLDLLSIPLLVVLSVANGAVSAVSLPTSAALTPQTVPTAELRPANAVMRMGINLGLILGASLGGVVVAWAGPGWALSGNAITFLGASICFSRLTLPARARQGGKGANPWQDLRDGWAEFIARSWVWVVVLQYTLVNAAVAGGIQVLGPLVADADFGRSLWGLVLAAQTLGALIGGVIAARSRMRRALFFGVAVTAVNAVPLAVLAGEPHIVLLFIAMFLNGMAIEQFGVAWELTLQENIPEDKLARVYSYDALGSFLALPMGEIGAGFATEHFGIRPSLFIMAALVLVATAMAVTNHEIRALTVKSQPAPSPSLTN